MPARWEGVMPIGGVQEFFRDSVARALRRQRLEVEDQTAFYVVSLLTAITDLKV